MGSKYLIYFIFMAKTVRDSEIATEAPNHTQNQNGCVNRWYISEKMKYFHVITYFFSRLQDSIWFLEQTEWLAFPLDVC